MLVALRRACGVAGGLLVGFAIGGLVLVATGRGGPARPEPPERTRTESDADGDGQPDGSIEMVQIVRDGGEVGWVVIAAAGVALVALSRPGRG